MENYPVIGQKNDPVDKYFIASLSSVIIIMAGKIIIILDFPMRLREINNIVHIIIWKKEYYNYLSLYKSFVFFISR